MASVMVACMPGGGGGSSSSGSTGVNSSNIAVMACDMSFENVMQQEVDVFEFINPKMTVLPMYLDESACVDSLMKGRASTAVLARELTNGETQRLKAAGRAPHTTRIAVDAIALIVNKDNPLDEITVSELTEVLDGNYRLWRDIEPSKLDSIRVVFDHQGSSTVRYMRDSLIGGRQFGASVYAQGGNKEVFEAVKNNKNALGVIGVSWIAADMSGEAKTAKERAETLETEDVTDMGFSGDVKVLKVRPDGADASGMPYEPRQPYQAYILDGSYPLFRSVYMINTGYAGTAAHAFYVFVTGWRGQKVIMSTGVLPSTVRPRVVSLN